MQVSRKKTRRYLLQKLYARIYGVIDEDRFHSAFFTGILDFDVDHDYLSETFECIMMHDDEILDIITQYAPKFDIETMQKTNILAIAIAIAEMLWIQEKIPAKVSINEAIELTKYFGDATGKNIVNGILNSFYQNIETHKKELGKAQPQSHHFFT